MQTQRQMSRTKSVKGDIMGGRGASAGRGGGFGGAGGGFTMTPNAGGGVTITPNPNQQNANAQNIPAAGSGVSDVNSHTTYFTPADAAIVSNQVTDGFAIAQRSGKVVPVGYYQTGYYANVNSELRDMAAGKRKSLTPETQKVVDAMDRNMRPLNAPMDAVRWTSEDAVADNIGLKGASRSRIISSLAKQDAVKVKDDYTSCSWRAADNTVAGQGGRNALIKLHYSKGAVGQFSPTGKEGEFVGARGVAQRFSNARMETVWNPKLMRNVTVLTVDCYVD